eukprot:3598007-Heterocapsa_arctica.AAC.1
MDTALGRRVASLLDGLSCTAEDKETISDGTLAAVVQAFAHYVPGGVVNIQNLKKKVFVTKHRVGTQQYDIDVIFQ